MNGPTSEVAVGSHHHLLPLLPPPFIASTSSHSRRILQRRLNANHSHSLSSQITHSLNSIATSFAMNSIMTTTALCLGATPSNLYNFNLHSDIVSPVSVSAARNPQPFSPPQRASVSVSVSGRNANTHRPKINSRANNTPLTLSAPAVSDQYRTAVLQPPSANQHRRTQYILQCAQRYSRLCRRASSDAVSGGLNQFQSRAITGSAETATAQSPLRTFSLLSHPSQSQWQSPVHAHSDGRDLDSTINSLQNGSVPNHWFVSDTSSYQSSSTAVSSSWINAEAVSLPDIAGTADLSALLPPNIRRLYQSERDMLFDDRRDGKRIYPPPPVKMVQQSEYISLVRRMVDKGMINFTQSPKAVNGLFAVPKDGDSQRLIIDARPANALFRPPPKVQLPTPDILARMRVPSDSVLYTAKLDIDNFYHRLRCPKWLQPYFALPPVRASDIDVSLARRYGHDALIYPMCATLPMGWSHSVYVAQMAHEHLINSAQALQWSPNDRLGAFDAGFSDYHLRPGRTLHAVYIDDLTLFSADPQSLHQMQSAYRTVADRAGLAVKAKKVVQPTCEPVDVLGLEISGRDHTIGLSIPKLEALRHDTIALILSGASITGYQLAHLVGRWLWAMLVNRPSLCAFSAVYRFIQTAKRRRFTLWPTVAMELAVVVGLAPLLVSRLSAPDFPTIIATDASETGRGVVAFTPPSLRHFLVIERPPCDYHGTRHGSDERKDNKNIYKDKDKDAYKEKEKEKDSHPNKDVSASNCNCDFMVPINEAHWRTIVADRWSRSEEIHLLELRALHTGVRWALSHRFVIGHRVSILCDNESVIGAVMKGRSSKRPFLQRLRALNALVMAAGLQLDVEYVPTKLNPADGPSRQ
jgi:Reverse transcriptase (RNA-dependent DNA polymerase)